MLSFDSAIQSKPCLLPSHIWRRVREMKGIKESTEQRQKAVELPAQTVRLCKQAANQCRHKQSQHKQLIFSLYTPHPTQFAFYLKTLPHSSILFLPVQLFLNNPPTDVQTEQKQQKMKTSFSFGFYSKFFGG